MVITGLLVIGGGLGGAFIIWVLKSKIDTEKDNLNKSD
jgi:hypothetical protein